MSIFCYNIGVKSRSQYYYEELRQVFLVSKQTVTDILNTLDFKRSLMIFRLIIFLNLFGVLDDSLEMCDVSIAQPAR